MGGNQVDWDVRNVAKRLEERDGVFVASRSSAIAKTVQDDFVVKELFGKYGTVVCVKLCDMVASLALVAGNQHWRVQFYEPELAELQSDLLAIAPGVVIVTGINSRNLEWLGWAMNSGAKWLVCGEVWSIHKEDDEWDYEVKVCQP